jgi:hypothetical protein
MPVDHGRYFTSTAVFLSEVSKFVFCVVVVAVVSIRKKEQEGKQLLLVDLFSEIFGGDAWKLSIPAGLYTVVSFSTNIYPPFFSFRIISNTSHYRILKPQRFKLLINSKSSPQRSSA